MERGGAHTHTHTMYNTHTRLRLRCTHILFLSAHGKYRRPHPQTSTSHHHLRPPIVWHAARARTSAVSETVRNVHTHTHRHTLRHRHSYAYTQKRIINSAVCAKHTYLLAARRRRRAAQHSGRPTLGGGLVRWEIVWVCRICVRAALPCKVSCSSTLCSLRTRSRYFRLN